jgi:hypothetical protein
MSKRVRRCPILVVVSIVLALSAPVQARSGPTTNSHWVLTTVIANFNSVDANDPCITNDVAIYMYDSVLHEDGDTLAGASIYFQYVRFNTCAGIPVLGGDREVVISDADYNIGRRLDGATLTKSFDMCFGENCGVPVVIDITWTGAGELQQSVYRQSSRDGNCRTKFKLITSQRDAVASGTVLVDGVDVARGPSSSAYSLQEDSLNITKCDE